MFQLDLTSHKSIYEQVIDKFKELIMTGVLPKDAKLPSVRELSKDLTINPNTVQKAYRELEREGFVYSAAGRGTFVADKEKITPSQKKVEELKRQIFSAYKELQYLGMTEDEAREIVFAAITEGRD